MLSNAVAMHALPSDERQTLLEAMYTDAGSVDDCLRRMIQGQPTFAAGP
jgi:hypothetical protein